MTLTSRLIVEFACRFILGGFFVFSGLMKVREPVLFQENIRSFHILSDPWPGLLAISLPWFEILCGVGILLRWLYAGSLALVSGSLVIFMAAISWSWMRGLDISCGCFGQVDLALGYSWHLLLNLTLLSMGLWLLRSESRRLRQPPFSEPQNHRPIPSST
ncbi:MAG: MauE/DoxX family redox-associated membrane protein [Verrucomicrobiota bacterium]